MFALDMPSFVAKEDRCPLWARLAPVLYLIACAACVRAVLLDPSADIGVYGMLVAVGLVPAFVLPGVFSTSNTRLAATPDGLAIDGSLVKIDDIRLEPAARGQARLFVQPRFGRKRSFLVSSAKDARALVAALPPASLPAGALVA